MITLALNSQSLLLSPPRVQRKELRPETKEAPAVAS